MLVEQPIAVHKADAGRVLAAARPSQVFGAMFNHRADPRYRRLRAHSHSGELGAGELTYWCNNEAASESSRTAT